jgi:hypothetical protein
MQVPIADTVCSYEKSCYAGAVMVREQARSYETLAQDW